MRNLPLFIALATLTACAAPQNTSRNYIEGMAHPGYCTNEYGQTLSDRACSEKATQDAKSPEPTPSDKMEKAIREGLKNK